MRNRSTPTIALALLILLQACRSQATDSSEVVRRDSAGVVIVENGASRTSIVLPWVIDSIPDLDIGTIQGEEHDQLFRVTGVAALSDGRIAVVNAGTQEVRFFDDAGVFLSSVGGRGQGPGEYQFPMLIPAAHYDTLWIYDMFGRFTQLGANGQLLQTIVPTGRVAQPAGVLHGKLVTSQGSARVGPDSPEAIVPNDIAYEMVGLSPESHDTIAVVEGFDLLRWKNDDQFGFTRVPFDVGPSVAVGRNRLYLAPGELPEVRAHDSTGMLREIFRIAQPSESVPQAAFDQAVVDEIAKAQDDAMAVELRRRYGKMSVPAVMPVFQQLRVDSNGNLWLEAFRDRDDDIPEWIVMDSTGVVLGRIATPQGVTIEQIGDDFILGTTRDESAVEHVVRYRLQRLDALGT